MNPVHIHLMLNHAPVVGVLFGVILLIYGLWRPSEEIKRVALAVFVFVALLAIPVYLTGEPAEDRVEGLSGVSHAVVEQHEEAARIAFTGMVVLGSVALMALLWFWGKPAVPKWVSAAVLPAALIVSILTAWTANLGGKVRHTEIRGVDAAQWPAAEPDDD